MHVVLSPSIEGTSLSLSPKKCGLELDLITLSDLGTTSWTAVTKPNSQLT